MTRHEIIITAVGGIVLALVVAFCSSAIVQGMNTPTLTELYEKSEFKKQAVAFDAAAGITQ